MAATAWDGEDIELDSDADVQYFQGEAMEHSDGGACDSAMWQLGACDELGCLSSDSDSDDGLYLPYHGEPSLASCCISPAAGGRVANNESSHSSGDGGSTRQHYWCCCCPLAPLQHQTQLICEQLCARGWHLHPSEVIPAERCPAMMPEGRGRPMEGRRVDFSNSAFHSAGWLFSDDPCEALYDRLQLATLVRPAGSPLAPQSPGLSPPTACLRAGCAIIGPEQQQQQQQQLAAVRNSVRVGGGCVLFLKANHQHCGTGTRVCRSVDQALAAVASAQGGQEFVLQPHVPRPMLWHRRKFHVRVWALFIARPVGNSGGGGAAAAAAAGSGPVNISSRAEAQVRGWLHDGGTVAVASEPWQPCSTNPAAQVTSTRCPRFVYTQWEHYTAAHAAITTNATVLSRRLAATWRGRVVRRPHFSLAGLDYMLDEDCRAHLLEANYGSRLIDEEMVAGLVSLVFFGEDGVAQGWRRLHDKTIKDE